MQRPQRGGQIEKRLKALKMYKLLNIFKRTKSKNGCRNRLGAICIFNRFFKRTRVARYSNISYQAEWKLWTSPFCFLGHRKLWCGLCLFNLHTKLASHPHLEMLNFYFDSTSHANEFCGELDSVDPVDPERRNFLLDNLLHYVSRGVGRYSYTTNGGGN